MRNFNLKIAALCAVTSLALTGCPAFWRAAAEIAHCTPELIEEIRDLLAGDGWQEAVAARGERAGDTALACAMRAIAGDGRSSPVTSLVYRSADPIPGRARLWLQNHKK